MSIDIAGLGRWLDAYGVAAATNDPDDIRALFSEDAAYYTSPYKEPWVGREAIVANWTAHPEAQRDLTFTHEPLSAHDDIGIAHWNMTWLTEAGASVELDGILVLRFDGDGRCSDHREWFFKRES
jgi:hypothetical protein